MSKRTHPRTVIGRQVAVAAFLAGIRHQEIANSLGLHRQSLYFRMIGERRWQSGELERIARLLGVTVDFLTGGNDAAR